MPPTGELNKLYSAAAFALRALGYLCWALVALAVLYTVGLLSFQFRHFPGFG